MDCLKCLIIDDEPIAREGIKEYISEIDFLDCVAECKNAIEAINVLQSRHIDLMFLDIQMPKVSGLEFYKNLINPPLAIIITAYQEYAIEGYEMDIVDYLLKPASFTRFIKAVNKARSVHSYMRSGNKSNSKFFFVKCNQKIEKIIFNDIVYVESLSNYVVIHTKTKKHITYLTFKSIEEYLPTDKFIRIHRGYIVAMQAITAIDGNELILGQKSLPIGKSFKEEVMRIIDHFLFKR